MASSFLIAASLAVLAAAPPESPMAVAKKVNAAYKKAILGKDYAHFVKNSTKDFTYVLANGQTAARQPALDQLRGALESFKKIEQFEVKVVSARRAEGGVLITSDTQMIAEIKMGEKVSKLVSNGRDETLVVPMGKGWAYKRVKIVKDTTTVDGKPMKM